MRDHEAAATERLSSNLFLRKQLAMYQEHKLKPRLPDRRLRIALKCKPALKFDPADCQKFKEFERRLILQALKIPVSAVRFCPCPPFSFTPPVRSTNHRPQKAGYQFENNWIC
jgi:hypothetical protein